MITYGFHHRSPLEVSRIGEPSSELARAMVSRSRENYIDNCTPRVDSDFHGGWKSKFELRSISKQHSYIYTLYSNFHSVPDSAMHAIRPRVPTLATSWKFTAGLEYDSKNVPIDNLLVLIWTRASRIFEWRIPDWRYFKVLKTKYVRDGAHATAFLQKVQSSSEQAHHRDTD